MAFTTRKRTGGGQMVEELDTSVDTDAARQEVVVRGPAGGTVDTELPAAAALGDGVANPTTPMVGACLMGYYSSGSTWYRLPIGNDADAQAMGNPMVIASGARLYNGASWDRERGNVEGTLLASAARTATTASADQVNYDGRGVMLFLDVTANPGGAETLTVTIQVKDPVSGVYTTVTAFAVSLTAANGDDVLTLFAGALETTAVAGHQVQGLALPRTWRARVVHSGAGSWTYSLGYASLG